MNFIEIDCYRLNGVVRETSTTVKINPALIVSVEKVFGATKIVTLNGDYYTSYVVSYIMRLIDEALKRNMYDVQLN